jgi:ubiquinone/menaquinone biosynthesis C-methylase UbiE
MLCVERWLSGFLRFFFRLLYNSFAWSYDLVAWVVSLGRWKSWVLSAVPELEGPRVLELGHGPGHLQKALKGKGVSVVGIDLSVQMGAIAKKRLMQTGQSSLLVRARAQKLPFKGEAFDQIVATFPTEYVTEAESLKSVHRVLCTGGHFVVLPVAWIRGQSTLEKAMAAVFRVTGQANEWNRQLSRLVAAAGFTVEEERVKLKGSEVLLLKAKKLTD